MTRVGAVPASTRDQGQVPLRLTRRGRLVVTLLGTVLAGSIGSAVIGLATATDAMATDSATVAYTVKPGDSLWSIAQHLQPTGDPRDLVVQLTRINPSAASGLMAGQVLQLPGQ